MWRVVRWMVRIALIGALVYGVWCVTAHFVSKHYFMEGMRHLADNPAAASRSFEIAVKLRPRNVRYRAALGRALLEQEDYLGAAKHLKQAVRGRPDDFGLWCDLGEAYLNADLPQRAQLAFEKAVEIRPKAKLALRGLAEAAVQTEDWEAALRPLRSLWVEDPSDLRTGTALVRVLTKGGHYDETLDVCAKVRKHLAASLTGEKATDEARSAASEILTAEGEAYHAKGRWAAAVSAYLVALVLNRENSAARAGLHRIPRDVAMPVVTEGQACAPAFSPDGRKLAFEWARDSTRGLYVVGLPDGKPQRIADLSAGGVESPPAWSPDGHLICYQRENKLWLVRADRSGNRPLVKNRLTFPQLLKLGPKSSRFKTEGDTADAFSMQRWPAWSPDGKHIAYCAYKPDLGSVTCVVDVFTGQTRSVHKTTGTPPKFEATFPPRWSLDGRVICGPLSYALRASEGLTIWSASGEVRRQMKVPTKGGGAKGSAVVAAIWAPDSRHVAVAIRESEGTASLAIIEASGKWSKIISRNVLYARGRPHTFARWLDAQHVWFAKKRGAGPFDLKATLFVSNLQGKLKTADDPFSFAPPGSDWDLSRDRKRLAVAAGILGEREDDVGLWVFELKKMREGQD